jgi:hypothetical protein
MELRAAAYFFYDPQLAAVFERGDDPHRLTAAHVAGRPLDTITDEERSKAKNVNFGTIYGIGPASLVAQVWKNYRLVISLDDAEGLLAGFTSLYPTMIAHRRDYTEACQFAAPLSSVLTGAKAAAGLFRSCACPTTNHRLPAPIATQSKGYAPTSAWLH